MENKARKFKMKNWSYTAKVFAGTFFASLIPMLICVFMLYSTFQYVVERNIIIDGNSIAEKLTASISTTIEEYEEAFILLQTNHDVKTVMLDRGSSDELEANVSLNLFSHAQNVPNSSGIALYDSGGLLKFSTSDDFPTSMPVITGVIAEARYSHENFTIYHDDNYNIYTATRIRGENGIYTGYIIGCIMQSEITKNASTFINSDSDIILYTYDGSVIFSSFDVDKSYTESISYSQKPSTIEGKSAFYSNFADGRYNIVVLKNPVLTTQTRDMIAIITALCILICLIISIVISKVMSNSVSKPINTIIKSVKEVKSGNLDTQINSKRSDEIGDLSNNFDSMTRELKKYLNEQLEAQRKLNDINIRMVQSQLNPHFLYNTLDTIKWLAKINECPEISSLSSGLAGILRTSIANEQFITLEDELNLVEKYIAIQMIRFSDKFTYNFFVEKDILDYIVPKLIIQPIVENSIIHGLEDCDSGEINIHAYLQNDNLKITVFDNGCGLNDYILEKINNSDAKILTGHLGLYNVNSIIKLNFGNEYGLSATSETGIGTTITITLPAIKED